MKTLDIKSIIIGALLTSTIFLGVAASVPSGTGFSRKADLWDNHQEWHVTHDGHKGFKPAGYEPFDYNPATRNVYYRKRIK